MSYKWITGLCRGTLELPLPYPVRQQQSLHLESLKTKFENTWNYLSFCNRLLVTKGETATRKALKSKEFNWPARALRSVALTRWLFQKLIHFQKAAGLLLACLLQTPFAEPFLRAERWEGTYQRPGWIQKCFPYGAYTDKHYLYHANSNASFTCQWWQGGKRDRQICTSSCPSSLDRACRSKR